MKGGYQILDLTGLDMKIGNNQVSISDPNILKQLDALKNHIENGYDFKRPLNNKLKPILLRIRDKQNYEKQESSIWANVAKKTDNLTFVIEAVVDASLFKIIQIEVVFELKQDEAENYYYGIKTAKYLFTTNVQISHGSFASIGVVGNAEIGGNAQITGNVSAGGDASIGGDLNVTGDANIFENIKDKNGHARFIEGEGSQFSIEGVTALYNKWSLSGTHLMLVFAFEIDANKSITSGDRIVEYSLPEWIMDKIAVLFGNYSVANQTFDIFTNDGTATQTRMQLRKQGGKLSIATTEALGSTVKLKSRIEFDLLIDNEDEE